MWYRSFHAFWCESKQTGAGRPAGQCTNNRSEQHEQSVGTAASGADDESREFSSGGAFRWSACDGGVVPTNKRARNMCHGRLSSPSLSLFPSPFPVFGFLFPPCPFLEPWSLLVLAPGRTNKTITRERGEPARPVCGEGLHFGENVRTVCTLGKSDPSPGRRRIRIN